MHDNEFHLDSSAKQRLTIRLILDASVVIVLLLARGLVFPLVMVSKRFERASRQFLFRLWGRATAWILGLRIEVRGTPPKAPFLLVCNHQSYLDGFVMAWAFGPIFVSMIEMQSWPFVGTMCRWLRVIFIDRKSLRDAHRVIAGLKDAIANGEAISLFPEGRTSPGDLIRPFHPALLQPAAEEGWDVYYATIRYRTPEGCLPASSVVAWARGEPFAAHAKRLFSLPRVHVTLTFGEEPIRHSDRKALAEALRAAVERQFFAAEDVASHSASVCAASPK